MQDMVNAEEVKISRPKRCLVYYQVKQGLDWVMKPSTGRRGGVAGLGQSRLAKKQLTSAQDLYKQSTAMSGAYPPHQRSAINLTRTFGSSNFGHPGSL